MGILGRPRGGSLPLEVPPLCPECGSPKSRRAGRANAWRCGPCNAAYQRRRRELVLADDVVRHPSVDPEIARRVEAMAARYDFLMLVEGPTRLTEEDGALPRVSLFQALASGRRAS